MFRFVLQMYVKYTTMQYIILSFCKIFGKNMYFVMHLSVVCSKITSSFRGRAFCTQNELPRSAGEHFGRKMHCAETRKSTRAAKCASPLRARALRWQNALRRSAGEHFGSKMHFPVSPTSTLHKKSPSTFRGRAFCFADCVCPFRGRPFRVQKASRRYDQCKAS